MASITSSSHRWVRSIGHSQSSYHLNPFLPLHSPSFLDIISVPCPLSVSSNPSQTHLDLHDIHPPLYFSLIRPFSYLHTHTHIHIHTYNTIQLHNRTLELPWYCQTLHLSLYISDDRSWLFPFIKTFMTLDPFYASSAVEVLYPYQPIMNSSHFSEAEWSASHLVCLVRWCSVLHSARLVFTQNLGFH